MAKLNLHEPGEPPDADRNALGDYADHLVVFANIARPVVNDRGFGPREETPADTYAHVDGEWVEVGKAFPIFFQAVQQQLAEAGVGNALGGVLMRPGYAKNNPRAWVIAPAATAAARKLLAEFDPDTVGVF